MDFEILGELSVVEIIAVNLSVRESADLKASMADLQVRPVFAVCVANDGCDDLSTGMLYRVLTDEAAVGEGLLRIIDDSGEDYLYPASRFVVVQVPQSEEQKLLAVASTDAL